MSVDFTATPVSRTSSDGSVFAAVPSWERNKQRRSFGGGRPMASLPMTASEQVVETRPPTGASVFAASPVPTATTRRPSGVAPVVIAAGILALGGLAAAGWYAYQPHDNGVAQLTPGSTSTVTTVTPAEPTAQIAATAPTPAPAVTRSSTTTSTTTTTRTATPRMIVTRHSITTQVSTPVARPAARNIEDSSVNTAATAPALPAFNGLAPAAATAATTPAPVEAAPAPVTAEVPSTPPTSTPPQ
ncbi:hypothetical protein [Phenylobacterium sp.]|uniref:hypothetical protein n=1 Tax=Phenylobacterium sp. TaxID=1871053 RepID=UPI00286D2299|nr:hypothetical protein [Phenylobacterium sp.]